MPGCGAGLILTTPGRQASGDAEQAGLPIRDRSGPLRVRAPDTDNRQGHAYPAKITVYAGSERL